VSNSKNGKTLSKDRFSSNIAIIIPCFNEELTIGQVIIDFQKLYPNAQIIVANNKSTDSTSSVAQKAGATVINEPRKGKGYAVSRLFADVNADCYILVDGDLTYTAHDSLGAVSLVLRDGVDQVLINRIKWNESDKVYRTGHIFGNNLLTKAFNWFFGLDIQDSLTGYRVLSRRFVKSFSSLPQGFEIETELNVHSQIIAANIRQMSGNYNPRPIGSESKLRTFRDGWKIVLTIIRLFRETKPITASIYFAAPFLIFGGLLLWRAIIPFLEKGVVEHFPSLIMGVGLLLTATMLFQAGLILSRTSKLRQEERRLAYMRFAGWLGETKKFR